MLLLVRHGRTDANAQGLLLGRLDPPLSEEGRRQAATLAAKIPDGARVIASPLLRTRETAEAFGRPVELDERWIELDYGELDGCRPEEVSENVWARWRTDASFVPAGGESLAALGNRVRSACDELSAEAAEDDVVVVSHVSPIKAAIAWALAVDDNVAWRMFVRDASITRVAIAEHGPVLLSFNEMPSAED
jgi:broad specificity phosphatase PhoE